jgi:hypothetical protein
MTHEPLAPPIPGRAALQVSAAAAVAAVMACGVGSMPPPIPTPQCWCAAIAELAVRAERGKTDPAVVIPAPDGSCCPCWTPETAAAAAAAIAAWEAAAAGFAAAATLAAIMGLPLLTISPGELEFVVAPVLKATGSPLPCCTRPLLLWKLGTFLQSMHEQLAEHCVPALKHSQYFFRQPDLLHLQPFFCDLVCGRREGKKGEQRECPRRSVTGARPRFPYLGDELLVVHELAPL